MAWFWHGIAVGLELGSNLSSALVWPTDELFNINSNINIIMEGQWTESGLCQKHTYLQIGIVPQLLCYSVFSKGAVLHFLCCMRVVRSSRNATF